MAGIVIYLFLTIANKVANNTFQYRDNKSELARRISLTSLSVTSGGSFTAWFDCDEMFTDHAVTIYGSLKKGLKTANIEG